MNLQTIINWAIPIVVLGVLGFVVFKLVTIMNAQLNKIKGKVGFNKKKEDKKEDEVENLKKILELKKQIKEVEGKK